MITDVLQNSQYEGSKSNVADNEFRSINSLDLLSNTSRVETPFIIAKIGGYSFGSYNVDKKTVFHNNQHMVEKTVQTFPNFMKNLTITKINGQVNQYTLNMVYAIRPGDDPNMLEKVFGKESRTRKIILSYGDLSNPSYIYKEEEAMISKVTTKIDLKNACIQYTINAVGVGFTLNAGYYSFEARFAKPSTVIRELLSNSKYHLTDIFYGMKNEIDSNLIPDDDMAVSIPAQTRITILQYLNYLVNCMCAGNDTKDSISYRHKYVIATYDDVSNKYGGPYFKITKVANNISEINSLDTYTIDIGYPSSIVTDFTIKDDQGYSLLFDYSKEVKQNEYMYRINDNGSIDTIYSPILTNAGQLYQTTEYDKNWWSKVTQFPISASITLKGLLRPAILMTYVKLNVLYFGQRHISSGYYIITKQLDSVSESGYRTTLDLLRIQTIDSENTLGIG